MSSCSIWYTAQRPKRVEYTRASMQRVADVLAKENATLWINHDKAQRDTLKMAPEFYE